MKAKLPVLGRRRLPQGAIFQTAMNEQPQPSLATILLLSEDSHIMWALFQPHGPAAGHEK